MVPDGAAAERMRQRWRIVLVDEFQDTDPVQWEVLDRAFSGHATMVLIGDPKQAIYAFRGGDVVTYLAAAETAATKQTLSVNWRSDAAAASTAFEALLGGAELGDPRIVVRPVEAHHDGSRLVGAPQPAPFRVRVVRRQDLGKRSGAADGQGGAAADRRGPRPRRTPPARVGRDLRGPAAAAARRRGDLLPARRPGRRPRRRCSRPGCRP